MAFLVTVLANSLAQVFLGLVCVAVFITAISVESVDLGSWNRTFSSSFLATVAAVFFLFFFGFLNDLLSALRNCQPSFLVLRFRLFNLKIFHRVLLMASLVAFYRLFALSDALIYLPKHTKGQEASLKLGINGFLHQLFPIV